MHPRHFVVIARQAAPARSAPTAAPIAAPDPAPAAVRPPSLVSRILSLQRTVGNSAARDLFRHGTSPIASAERAPRPPGKPAVPMERGKPSGAAKAVPVARRVAPVQVRQRASRKRLQRKWRLENAKVTTSNEIDYSRKNGTTSGLAVPMGAFASAVAEQKQGFVRQKVGGEAQIANASTMRYIFRNDGTDNDFLHVFTHGSLAGNARSEALRFARAAGIVWGEVAERTASQPTPPWKSMFDPLKDGGLSTSKLGDLGTVDADIPIGDAAVHVRIPLKRVEEGEFAPFSPSMDKPYEAPASIAEVEIVVGAHASAEADIESAFFGLSPWVFGSDANIANSAATFNLQWESRPAPAQPKASAAAAGSDVAPAAAQCGMSRKDTPVGKVRIDAGPLKGKDVEYGDPRHKHTKVGDCPVPQLEKAANDRDPDRYKGELKRFSQACQRGDTAYGSQLADNASSDADYRTLVKDALEKGTARGGKFHHAAGSAIGVDVQSKQGTKKYRVDVSSSGHGAHVIPLT